MDEQVFAFVMLGVVLILVVLFGIFGNVASMIILSRPKMRSSISFLLIGLACSDTLLIAIASLIIGLPTIHQYTGVMFDYFYKVRPHALPYLYPMGSIAQTMTVYLTVMVSIERYIVVCHPLRARALCTYGRAKICVAAILVFSILFNLPRFWQYACKYDGSHSKIYNTAIYFIEPTPLYDIPLFKFYGTWLYFMIIYILPFTSLAILNALIYKEVRRSNVERQKLSPMQCHEIRITNMLLCVVLVFFVCYMLALFVHSTLNIKNNMLTAIAVPLITFNSSVNFILYVIFLKRFRQLFLHMFRMRSCCSMFSGKSPEEVTEPEVTGSEQTVL